MLPELSFLTEMKAMEMLEESLLKKYQQDGSVVRKKKTSRANQEDPVIYEPLDLIRKSTKW